MRVGRVGVEREGSTERFVFLMSRNPRKREELLTDGKNIRFSLSNLPKTRMVLRYEKDGFQVQRSLSPGLGLVAPENSCERIPG